MMMMMGEMIIMMVMMFVYIICKHIISIIKALILTDKTENSPHTFNIPIFTFGDDLEKIIRYHVIGQVWIISSFKTFSLIDKIIDDFLHFAVDCRLIAFESKYDYVKEISKSESLDFYDISFSKSEQVLQRLLFCRIPANQP